MSQNQIAAQRLYLNADKSKLVGEGSLEAAFLYATEGDEIPGEMAEQFGLVDGALPAKKAKAETKPADAPAAKPSAPAETKPAAPAETKPAAPAETRA